MERAAKSPTNQIHVASPAAERATSKTSGEADAGSRTGATIRRSLAAWIHTSTRMAAQRNQLEGIQNSPRMASQLKSIARLSGKAAQFKGVPDEDELPQGKFEAGERRGSEEEELLQGRFAPVQRQSGLEEDALLQGKFAPLQRMEPESEHEPRENNTGLPDNLKAGIESLSGMSLDHVKVHFNSVQPAQLNALAYAQGSAIHIAPGQEQHLPHEAWHVVQQAQGRVKPTVQMRDDVPVNDDAGLEHEADVMGARADAGVERHETSARPDSTGSVLHSSLATVQSSQPDGFFDAAQLRSEPADVFSRQRPAGANRIPGGAVVQRARWLFTEDAWINPDTLDPIGPELVPPEKAQEGDVWDDKTNELTSASNRMEAIFEGRSNRAPKVNLPTNKQFSDLVSNLGKPGIGQRVQNALNEVPTEKLSKETVLVAIEKHFKDYKPGLQAATRDPLFSETLLECIRNRQSQKWIQATTPQKVLPQEWVNQELQHWNVRHYTSKLNIVLGDDLGAGIFTVRSIEAPPFNEIISTVTLATMKAGGGVQNAKRSGDKILMTYTGGAASSGHTTGLDWANVGNVGDTFYGLFYKNKPATGITPPFITDAVYYATWSVEDFGVGWASADWLGTAAHSQEKDGQTPGGIARTGQLSDIIASIFPEATTRDFSQTGNEETPESEERRKQAFAAMSNFEIKKHGPMPVNAWIPIEANIAKARGWWVDTTKGKFVKLKLLLPPSVLEKL